MADQVASRYDNGQPASWIEAGTGKHYVMGMVNGKPTGQKVYQSPRAVDPYSTEQDPYKPGLLGGGSEWNSATGQWDKKSNTLEKVTLASALLPFAAFAMGGMGGEAAGAGASGPAMAVNPATGMLESTAITTAPDVVAAGAGSALPAIAAAGGGGAAAAAAANGGGGGSGNTDDPGAPGGEPSSSGSTRPGILSRVMNKDTLSSLTDVLGNAAKSAGAANNAADRLRIEAENAKLDRDKFATAAPATRMTTAIRAALAKNATPSQVHWGGPGSGLRGEVPTYTGGAASIYPAMKDPSLAGSDGMLETVLADELAAQKRGGLTGGGQDTNMGVADPSQVGQTSPGDKILGGTALGSGILAAILKSRVGA